MGWEYDLSNLTARSGETTEAPDEGNLGIFSTRDFFGLSLRRESMYNPLTTRLLICWKLEALLTGEVPLRLLLGISDSRVARERASLCGSERTGAGDKFSSRGLTLGEPGFEPQ